MLNTFTGLLEIFLFSKAMMERPALTEVSNSKARDFLHVFISMVIVNVYQALTVSSALLASVYFIFIMTQIGRRLYFPHYTNRRAGTQAFK